MKLGQKQELFARLLPRLLDRAHELGFEVRCGDLARSVEEATRLGKPNSVHTLKLAIDIHLFKGGNYLTDTEAHRPLGEFWVSLHPLCRWGGSFKDGNHYSLTHGGVR